jgi:hypothetical protein
MGPSESRAAGGVLFVPDSTPKPTAAAAGAHADDRSTARQDRGLRRRRARRPDRPAGLPRTHGAPHGPPVGPTSDDTRLGRRATARSWPDSRTRRCASRRSVAALERSSTARAPTDGRSRVSRARACARSPVPRVPRSKGTALIVAAMTGQGVMVASHQSPGTIVRPRRATLRRRSRRPHWGAPLQSRPRTVAAPPAVPPRADQAIATRLARLDLNTAVFSSTSQPPPEGVATTD